MSANIHPTAIVDPGAVVENGVSIGPFAIVGPRVVLGAGTILHAHASVVGSTRVGRDNIVFPYAVLGAEPQDLKHRGEETFLEIGNGNRFREHVTVHSGTTTGGGVTRLGSGGLFMVGCHVAHDCEVGDRVVLANHVLLAGHAKVGDGAIVNGAAACHHFTTIGRLAYVGGLTRLVQDVPPFTIVEGHPARIRGANVVGLRRAGVAEEGVERIKQAVRSIFMKGSSTAAAGMRALADQRHEDPLLAELLSAIEASTAGRFGRAREVHRASSAASTGSAGRPVS